MTKLKKVGILKKKRGDSPKQSGDFSEKNGDQLLFSVGMHPQCTKSTYSQKSWKTDKLNSKPQK